MQRHKGNAPPQPVVLSLLYDTVHKRILHRTAAYTRLVRKRAEYTMYVGVYAGLTVTPSAHRSDEVAQGDSENFDKGDVRAKVEKEHKRWDLRMMQITSKVTGYWAPCP